MPIRINKALEILVESILMWNLKLSEGSKYTPRYFIAGTWSEDFTITRGGQGKRLTELTSLLLITMGESESREIFEFVTIMYLVFSGCSESLFCLKKVHILWNSRFAFSIRVVKLSSSIASAVSSANNRARKLLQEGRSLM